MPEGALTGAVAGPRLRMELVTAVATVESTGGVNKGAPGHRRWRPPSSNGRGSLSAWYELALHLSPCSATKASSARSTGPRAGTDEFGSRRSIGTKEATLARAAPLGVPPQAAMPAPEQRDWRLEWQLGVVHGRSDRKLHRLVKPSMQSSMQQARTVAPNRPIRRSRAPQLLTISTFRTVEQSPSLAFGAVEASEPSNRSPGSREMPWGILGLGRFDSRPR